MALNNIGTPALLSSCCTHYLAPAVCVSYPIVRIVLLRMLPCTTDPNVCSHTCITLTHTHTGGLDGVHARRTRNASPVGDLFKKACDNIGCVFVVLTLLSVMGTACALRSMCVLTRAYTCVCVCLSRCVGG